MRPAPKGLNSLHRKSRPTATPWQAPSGKQKSRMDDPTTPRYAMSGFHITIDISLNVI